MDLTLEAHNLLSYQPLLDDFSSEKVETLKKWPGLYSNNPIKRLSHAFVITKGKTSLNPTLRSLGLSSRLAEAGEERAEGQGLRGAGEEHSCLTGLPRCPPLFSDPCRDK